MGHPLTLDEAKALRPGDIVYACFSGNRKGEPHKVRVSGQVKTWKRDPNRVQVPWKHGLYTYGYITEGELREGNCYWTLDEEFVRS